MAYEHEDWSTITWRNENVGPWEHSQRFQAWGRVEDVKCWNPPWAPGPLLGQEKRELLNCAAETWQPRGGEGDGLCRAEPGEAFGEACFLLLTLIGIIKTK